MLDSVCVARALITLIPVGGGAADLHEDVGLFQRLTVLEQEFPGASVLVHKLGILSPVSTSCCMGLLLLLSPSLDPRLSKDHGLE